MVYQVMRGNGIAQACRHEFVRSAGLLQKKAQDGTQTTMEATLMAQQTPGQREQVRHSHRRHARLPLTRLHVLQIAPYSLSIALHLVRKQAP